jgi:hypothetical protein
VVLHPRAAADVAQHHHRRALPPSRLLRHRSRPARSGEEEGAPLGMERGGAAGGGDGDGGALHGSDPAQERENG